MLVLNHHEKNIIMLIQSLGGVNFVLVIYSREKCLIISTRFISCFPLYSVGFPWMTIITTYQNKSILPIPVFSCLEK